MARSTYFRLSVLAALGVLAAGCATTPRPPGARAKTEAGPKEAVKAKEQTRLEQRAEAYAHYAAAISAEMNRDYDQAQEEFYQAALFDPGEQELVLELSRRLLQGGKSEKAVALLTRATAQRGAPGILFARLSQAYLQQGRTNQAIAALQTGIKRSPGSMVSYQGLFQVYMRQKQHAEALKVLDLAAKQTDADAGYLADLAELYALYGRQVPAAVETAKARALAALEQAARLGSQNLNQQFKLADGFYRLGEYRKAAEVYAKLLQQAPNLPLIREKLADTYLRSSEKSRAAEQLEAIAKADPTNPQAQYLLGTLAFEDHKFEKAIDYFRRVVLLNPDFEQVYYDLAGAQINLNKPGDALATLDKARQKYAQNFVMEFYSGLACTRLKDYAAAIKHFTAAEVVARATKAKTPDHVFYYQFGAACERMHDYEQAEQHFQKCLEQSPDYAEGMNYLGYMWADRGVNLQKARELIEKAVKLEPTNHAFLDSLGWVLFKLNQPQEALTYLRKAIELSPEPDATLYDHLGDVYVALRLPDKAQEAWRKSLGIEPSPEIERKMQATQGGSSVH